MVVPMVEASEFAGLVWAWVATLVSPECRDGIRPQFHREYALADLHLHQLSVG